MGTILWKPPRAGELGVGDHVGKHALGPSGFGSFFVCNQAGVQELDTWSGGRDTPSMPCLICHWYTTYKSSRIYGSSDLCLHLHLINIAPDRRS